MNRIWFEGVLREGFTYSGFGVLGFGFWAWAGVLTSYGVYVRYSSRGMDDRCSVCIYIVMCQL